MLGWHINIFKTEVKKFIAYDATTTELRIASWSTGEAGLDWLKKLAQSKRIQELGGNGYPYRFSAKAFEIIPIIKTGYSISSELSNSYEYVFQEYERRTLKIDPTKFNGCSLQDQLLIEAWDQR